RYHAQNLAGRLGLSTSKLTYCQRKGQSAWKLKKPSKDNSQMSTPTTPTIEPTQFAAGDSLSWTKNLSDQQSKDGWTTLYCFRGYGLSFLDVPSDETANNHLTTITPQMSTGLL